jgi:hypothetical protein
MYEPRHAKPISRAEFMRRLWKHVAVAAALVALSLAVGMAGYIVFEHLSWIDAFLNASMLMGGMGPVDPPHTVAGKLFAGCFALYAGLVFIVTAALMFTPVLHRLMHLFHWNEKL